MCAVPLYQSTSSVSFYVLMTVTKSRMVGNMPLTRTRKLNSTPTTSGFHAAAATSAAAAAATATAAAAAIS